MMSSERLRALKLGAKGVVVVMGGQMSPLQDTGFFETGEGNLPFKGFQPTRSKLQTQLPGGLASQSGEYSIGLVPKIRVCEFLHAHIGFIVAEVESDGCKARGVNRLEQGGEEAIQLRTFSVTGDEC